MFEPHEWDHVLIYGARLAGRGVHDYLKTKSVPVAGFLDRDSSLGHVDGLQVSTAQAWASHHDASRACVIIGLFNNYVDVSEVVEHLQACGYGRVVSLIEFVRRYPEDQPPRYWLVDPRHYEANAHRVQAMRGRLADETSRELLDRIVEFRTHGDYRKLAEPSPRQYFPDDLPRWPQPLRFIDCGAYTGDTIEAMRDAGFAFEAVATFEPNLTQFQALTRSTADLNAFHFPCGVSDANKVVGFDPALGTGAHLVESGGDPVTCVRLDDVLPNFAPNLIKMDIEGEEPAALRGAQRLLRQSRPNLAISVYHEPDHLWSILEQLDSYELGYRFYLRCHARCTFETILYAFAPEHAEDRSL